MNSKIVTIAGCEYLVRYPVGALILAEKKLGWNLSLVKDKVREGMSFGDMCTIVRYGLHRGTDGVLITDEEFAKILDSVDVTEFNEVVPDILSVFNSGASGSETPASTKN